jgi:hypothetical protein
MKPLSCTTRERLHMQGFENVPDRTLAQVHYWLRLAPALCLVWGAAGIAFASPLLLFALVPFAVAGALGTGHPFDLFYNRVIRRWTRTPALPAYGAPRRFACALAAAWASAMALAFAVGARPVGYALGVVFVVFPLIQATTDFCVPSFLYRTLVGGRRRSGREQRGESRSVGQPAPDALCWWVG